MRKLTILLAFALGYVLGAQAGRKRYEQIAGAFDKVRRDPRVQAGAQQAVDVAKAQAPVVADKVTSAVSSAAAAATSKVGGSHDDEVREPHHMAGPQGDLP